MFHGKLHALVHAKAARRNKMDSGIKIVRGAHGDRAKTMAMRFPGFEEPPRELQHIKKTLLLRGGVGYGAIRGKHYGFIYERV